MAAEVFRNIEGIYVGKHFSDDAIRSTMSYKPRPGDLFLTCYPKSGSSWTHRIIYNILMDAADPDDPMDPYLRIPFLDMRGGDAAIYAPRPAAFKTHLPFSKAPYSPEAKYIHLARNPYDVCVSFYYHTRNTPAYNFHNGTFDEFFELFLQGRVDFGDYFQNVLSWYRHRNDANVLSLTYEELKENTREHIVKIAAFIDPDREKKLKEKPELVERILEKTNVENMKKVLNYNTKRLTLKEPRLLDNVRPELQKGLRTFFDFINVPMTGDFVRKAQVGDWRNHFSLEQVAKMKERIAEATAGTDFMSLWKDVDLP
ncbi:hypothetical protein V5799_011176 [Amblyomma americanum]|uniref:Sulfotransferase domain-containing protein n=1 Tax=Amblyomma americanum TaxID=6943 RepID=A0AAQ4EA79_AMBAM